MLYITSLVVIYCETGSLYLLSTFIHFAFPLLSVSGNLKFDLFVYEFVLFLKYH